MTNGILFIILGSIWFLISDSAANQRQNLRSGIAVVTGLLFVLTGAYLILNVLGR